ncbi:hypothetical protein XP1712_09730, partial [Xanthomonas perforans]
QVYGESTALAGRPLASDCACRVCRSVGSLTVGYQSPSAFGHAFKRMFGAAPRRLVRPGER